MSHLVILANFHRRREAVRPALLPFTVVATDWPPRIWTDAGAILQTSIAIWMVVPTSFRKCFWAFFVVLPFRTRSLVLPNRFVIPIDRSIDLCETAPVVRAEKNYSWNENIFHFVFNTNSGHAHLQCRPFDSIKPSSRTNANEVQHAWTKKEITKYSAGESVKHHETNKKIISCPYTMMTWKKT